ncbi:interleukin-5 receptor subunit alpha [Octodon degus]|uniref:Interleukin-5 receptor subunit alpha n=1 Tax=Octodon degus TaxID=10160 RepID=A0A6P3EQ02_OCTDE|nr:interleukin-5 receptor subunit alpha [Octodon degus]
MVPAFLILFGAFETLQTDLFPDKKFLLLPPMNFTIQVTGLAQVLLHWEPNPDQDQKNINLKYHVKINASQEEDYETRNTQSKCETTLHQGFSARVRTILWRDSSFLASSWVSAERKSPPGSPGTSIVNLTCTTNTAAGNYTNLKLYQVSLHCTWLAGKDAPEDTQYFLYYRYGAWTEECREYNKDTLNRNTACWFPRTFIHSKARGRLAVHVNGSSKHATIKPFDQLFDIQAIDQPNPPMNVTAETEGSHLSIQWEKPVSAFPSHCFEYEVKIYNTNGYYQVEKTTTSTFISTTDGVSKYSIQVRATVSPQCRAMGLWSKWSQPIHVGNEQQPMSEWLLITLTATLCFVSLISLLLCRIYRLWPKLFPPVPAPKSSIKDLIVATNWEKAGPNETEIEAISYIEEPAFEILESSAF